MINSKIEKKHSKMSCSYPCLKTAVDIDGTEFVVLFIREEHGIILTQAIGMKAVGSYIDRLNEETFKIFTGQLILENKL